MEINPIAPADRQYVQRYDAAGFRVSGVDFAGSVIVLPERTLSWAVQEFGSLDMEALRAVVDATPRPELLVIGCGRRGMMLAEPLRRGLRAAGIGFETMDTGAACRTYNVLMNDGRRVAAALIVLGA